MLAPKKCKSSAGVTKIPAILLITALQIEVATFPPLAEVNIIHMLTVVGKHVIINKPSTNAEGIRFGATLVKTLFSGTPTRKGHKANIVN